MAKRFTSSAVNWSFIIQTLPSHDSSRLTPLKIASEKYLREIASKPEELKKIDWNSYKKKIFHPGMVESFQKSYENLKIPYPSDQGILSETEKYNEKLKEYVNNKIEDNLRKTEELKKLLKKLESVMKYSTMSLEEYYLANPHKRVNTENPKPFLWDFPYKKKENL